MSYDVRDKPVNFMISGKGVPEKFRHLENLILFLKNAIFFEESSWSDVYVKGIFKFLSPRFAM